MTDDRRTPAGLRRANTAAALRAVLDEGPLPRADLTERLGLAAGTVSRIVAPLVAAGLLRELPALSGAGGRPRIPVDLVPRARYAIGVHLGRQRTTAGLVDLRGRVRRVRTHERGPGQAPHIIDGAAELVAVLRREAGAVPVLGVGVATGGWVDPATGVVVDNEALGWQDVPLRALLTGVLGADLPVVVDSGARAQATAEVWFGCARGAETSAHLFTGNVIDAALALGSRVHTGARSAAGMIGHLPVRATGPACACGRRGVLQAVASDRAVVDAAAATGIVAAGEGLERLSALAAAGTEAADGLLRERARHIGTAVAHLVDLFDPSLVVLSGGVLPYVDEVRATAAGLVGGAWDPDRVQPTALGPHALAASSGALLLAAYYADPLAYESIGAPAFASTGAGTTQWRPAVDRPRTMERQGRP
ncbi:ROK family protein [Streptomyces sp. NPDC001828]|uniref:ROK family transcriptional regulator n=1 Tax=Streptomyces sp. NPDC001828 TaxID=3364615 RepID=UPI0036897687